jgi:tetratricopeptide (TPR) repeat protein
LVIEKELGDRAGQAATLGGLGNCYESLGQYVKAMELYEESLVIFKELDDRKGQAAAKTPAGRGTGPRE